MPRLALLPMLVNVLASCAAAPPAMKPIEFLTREGCVQTTTMRGRLDEAIRGMANGLTYTVIDLDTLPATDARKGHPTPSVLYGGVDLFGMAEPKPPYPEPT
jgi:hypothetical protein